MSFKTNTFIINPCPMHPHLHHYAEKTFSVHARTFYNCKIPLYISIRSSNNVKMKQHTQIITVAPPYGNCTYRLMLKRVVIRSSKHILIGVQLCSNGLLMVFKCFFGAKFEQYMTNLQYVFNRCSNNLQIIVIQPSNNMERHSNGFQVFWFGIQWFGLCKTFREATICLNQASTWQM